MTTFWSLAVGPNSFGDLVIPDDCCVRITNACMIDATDNNPVRVIAHIESFEELDPNQKLEDIKTVKSDVQIAFFLAGKSAHSNLNVLLSPVNMGKIEVQGNATVHLSGVVEPIPFDEYDFMEEEEEEEEEANEPAEN